MIESRDPECFQGHPLRLAAAGGAAGDPLARKTGDYRDRITVTRRNWHSEKKPSR